MVLFELFTSFGVLLNVLDYTKHRLRYALRTRNAKFTSVSLIILDQNVDGLLDVDT